MWISYAMVMYFFQCLQIHEIILCVITIKRGALNSKFKIRLGQKDHKTNIV